MSMNTFKLQGTFYVYKVNISRENLIIKSRQLEKQTISPHLEMLSN